MQENPDGHDQSLSYYFSAILKTFMDFGGLYVGGRGGIRTHEGRKPLPVFKTGAFNRSATRPLKAPS